MDTQTEDTTGFCVAAFLMVAVLAQPSVMWVPRAGLELLVSWAPQLPRSPPLNQAMMRCWRHILSVRLPKEELTFPVLDFLFFVYQTDLSLSACDKVAKKPVQVRQRGHMYVINSIPNVIFQLYSFQSFFCASVGITREICLQNCSQECYRVAFRCRHPKPQSLIFAVNWALCICVLHVYTIWIQLYLYCVLILKPNESID